MPILMFTGEFDIFSNFYLCPVVVDGIKFQSTEHAYQTLKTADPEWRKKIRNAKTPGIAKRLGRQCPAHTNWDHIKRDVMFNCVLNKFSQNDDLKAKLLATGEEHLEEGNTWGDTFWGTVNGKGENHLGTILMEVRKILRTQENK